MSNVERLGAKMTSFIPFSSLSSGLFLAARGLTKVVNEIANNVFKSSSSKGYSSEKVTTGLRDIKKGLLSCTPMAGPLYKYRSVVANIVGLIFCKK